MPLIVGLAKVKARAKSSAWKASIWLRIVSWIGASCAAAGSGHARVHGSQVVPEIVHRLGLGVAAVLVVAGLASPALLAEVDIVAAQ